MADYFVSDLHLRPDRPERGARLRRFLQALERDDRLFVVGDLCDFWFASRHRADAGDECDGLRALADRQGRGGHVTVLLGNHDAWLGPYYAERLGLSVEPRDVLEVGSHGARLHLAHGHLVGARAAWKGVMESRAFLTGFRHLPRSFARGLEHALDRSNDRTREADDRRHFTAFRRYASALDDRIDLVVLGHVHRAHLDLEHAPGVVVLGDWKRRTSYLRIDAHGARFHVVPDGPGEPAQVSVVDLPCRREGPP